MDNIKFGFAVVKMVLGYVAIMTLANIAVGGIAYLIIYY
jgi:hypothetical protein